MVLALFQHCVVLITSSLFEYLIRRNVFCLRLWLYALSVYAESWLVLAEEDWEELARSCVNILSVSTVLLGLGMI